MSTPIVDHLAAEFVQLVPRLFAKLDNADLTDKTERKPSGDLTHLQIHLIEELYRHPEGLSMTRLAKGIRISKQQLTPLVARLEERGYIDKRQDKTDKRLVRLSLTDKGRDAVGRRWESFYNMMRKRLEPLGEEDRNDLQYALRKLVSLLDRMD